MQTGYQPQQSQQQQHRAPPLPPTAGGGNYAFLSQPPPSFSANSGQRMQSSFTGSNSLAPQITGYPGGGASGLMSQATGYQGMTSQPTGYGGGLMSQPTGMSRLQAQPTGMPHDPRLQSMMQSFMPSNMSQVGYSFN
jgi:hypothetical protein